MNRQLRNAFLSLVQSLSPAEKRLVSLNISKSGSKSAGLLDLIKLAQQLETWDEELVRARIPASRLDHRIVYASEKIFQLLTEFQKGQDQEILSKISRFEAAIELDLVYFVLQFVDDIIQECQREEKYELLLHSLNKAISYLSRGIYLSTHEKELNRFISILDEANREYQVLLKVREFASNFKFPSQRRFQLDGILDAETASLIENQTELDLIFTQTPSSKVRIEILSLQLHAAFSLRKYNRSVAISQNLIGEFKSHPWQVKQNPKRFFDLALFQSILGSNLGLEEVVRQSIQIINTFQSHSTIHSYYESMAILSWFIESNNDWGVENSLLKLDYVFRKKNSRLDQNELIKLIYIALLAERKNGNLVESQKWAERLFSRRDYLHRCDIFAIGILHLATIYYESGQLDLLHSVTDKGTKYISSNLPEKETAILFLKKLHQISKMPLLDHKLLFHELLSELHEIQEKTLVFDYLNWIKKFL